MLRVHSKSVCRHAHADARVRQHAAIGGCDPCHGVSLGAQGRLCGWPVFWVLAVMRCWQARVYVPVTGNIQPCVQGMVLGSGSTREAAQANIGVVSNLAGVANCTCLPNY